MAASTSRSSEFEDQEIRVLEGLIDAFSSTFSLRAISSAYCKAGRNPDLTAEILYDSQETASNASDQTIGTASSKPASDQTIGTTSSKPASDQTIGTSSSKPLWESIVNNNSSRSDNYSKPSKPKKQSVSMGTVSCVLGRGYDSKPKKLANEACRATKPLKLDMRDLPRSGGDVSSDSVVKNDQLHKDTEDFLFQMLGDGFQLKMDVIRQVLGSCGYDAKESIEKLMNMSAATLKNSEDIVAGSTRKGADEYPEPKSSFSQEHSEHMDLPQRDKERLDLQREVLSSLFNVPERIEEVPKKTRPIRAVKLRPIRKVVSEPLIDTIEHSNVLVEPQEDSEDEEEEDSYQVLRRATKEHWVTMKEYYKSAFDAFANEDRALADELLKKGHYYNQKAREADQKSNQLILERRKESLDVVVVDLQDHGTKEAIRTLKFYLSNLSGIPSQALKVIMGDAKDTKKNTRRLRVLELLEKESIKWTEEENPGTILIQLEDTNPEDLSFIGERLRKDD